MSMSCRTQYCTPSRRRRVTACLLLGPPKSITNEVYNKRSLFNKQKSMLGIPALARDTVSI